MKKFSIVGAGRLGTALGAALVRRGWLAEAIVDKDARAAREGRSIIGRGRASTSYAAAAEAGGAVIIAVPDDAVGRVAAALARSGGAWAGRPVFHTSGLVPSTALGPLARRGARTASLHPVQSFPRKDAPASAFKGITWGIEGGPAAVEAAGEIVRALRGHILLLSEEDKPLYHAACALASNAFVALEWTAAGILQKAGITEDAAIATLLPLVQGTLQNVKSLGLEKALTGPVLRGDIATVRKHMEALGSDPRAREIYTAAGKLVLRLAAKRGLPAGRVRTLKRLLEGR
ncbi:MAG: DUF2520 domain-containing protein [Candidatus Aminicenantes bacterium]|nr:MAG: DUF2520 domain-containing protein [Candidatus Aminicenantes bacterium]